jgi:beta porphyranase A C-terminal/Porphyranase catalytic subdomain 1
MISIHLSINKQLGGQSRINTQQFFNTNNNQNDTPSIGHYNSIKNDNFVPGRFFLHYNSLNIEEDPTNAGFADPTSFARANDIPLNNILVNQSQVMNGFSSVLNAYFAPSFMSNTTLPNPGTPVNYQAMSQLIIEALNNINQFGVFPQFYEIWGEPNFITNWSFTDSATRGIELANFAQVLIPLLKQNFPKLTIIGPCDASLYNFNEYNFEGWNWFLESFINQVGNSIDALSYHVYQTSVGHTEAIIDHIENYFFNQYSNNIPVVVSEFGGNASDGLSPSIYWNTLYPIFGDFIVILNKPFITKAIPYICPVIPASNPCQVWSLFDSSGNETPTYSFITMWREVAMGASYVTYISNDYRFPCCAFLSLDQTTLYIGCYNTSSTSQEVHITIAPQYQSLISNILLKRFYWDGTDNPTVSQETVSTWSILTLTGNETDLLVITFSHPLPPNSITINEQVYFGNVTLTSISSQPITGTINIPTTKVEYAYLKYAANIPSSNDHVPTILINGHQLPLAPTPFDGTDNPSGYFGTQTVRVHNAYLTLSNQITLKYSQPGGYFSSMSLVLGEII